jgi:ubiquinone/menaquinone biosynthesis C-methylase UbiE
MFDRIAGRYDLMNSVMSAGMHHRWRARAADLARIGPGGSALDVCCGTGDLALELARRAGPGGRVVGLDFSAPMLELAREKSRAAGDTVAWVQGNALELPFEGGEFDAATVGFGARNVVDLERGIAEMARVVRPGGVVAVFDGDYASLTFGCSDPSLSGEIEPALQSIIMSSPRVMRELPRLLPRAGLRLTAVQAHVYAEAGSSTFMLNLAETYAPLTASSGQLPAAHVDAWLTDQRRAAAAGTFFAACNYYAYIAQG